MADYHIKILTENGGKRSLFVADGEARFTEESVTLSYADKEGQTRLRLGKTALMRREGTYGLTLSFREGAQTEGRLSFGTGTGELSLFTSEYRYTAAEGQIRVFLRYTLFSGAEASEMTVKIHAVLKAMPCK